METIWEVEVFSTKDIDVRFKNDTVPKHLNLSLCTLYTMKPSMKEAQMDCQNYKNTSGLLLILAYDTLNNI